LISSLLCATLFILKINSVKEQKHHPDFLSGGVLILSLICQLQ